VVPTSHRQVVGVPFQRRGAPSTEQLNVRHLPENSPGHVLPAPGSPGFTPLTLLASPKDREVWGLAGFRARELAASSLLAWPMGGSWRGATVPPEPLPRSGGGLRLGGAVDGHPDCRSTHGERVRCDTARSSGPFLHLFDVPFLLAAGTVCLGAVRRR